MDPVLGDPEDCSRIAFFETLLGLFEEYLGVE
jgi:hypothetical protein